MGESKYILDHLAQKLYVVMSKHKANSKTTATVFPGLPEERMSPI